MSTEISPLLERGESRLQSIFSDFKQFIAKGNVVDLAIGIVIGGAFSAIVNSFVEDMFTPVISLIAVSGQFNEQFWILRKGANYPYHTRAEAIADGAVIMNYGNFTNIVLNFLLVSAFCFVFIKIFQRMKAFTLDDESIDTSAVSETVQHTNVCIFCKESIHSEATRCSHCTSELT